MDITYLLFLQRLREAAGAVADGFFLHITAMGEGLITYLLLAFIYWCVDKRAGQLMALNVSVACTWNQFIKNVCKIDRPCERRESFTGAERHFWRGRIFLPERAYPTGYGCVGRLGFFPVGK